MWSCRRDFVGEEAQAILTPARSALARGPLTESLADELSDELLDYLVRKNGNAVFLRDREDKAIRASFEVFTSTVGDTGLEGMAVEVEELLSGTVGEIR